MYKDDYRVRRVPEVIAKSGAALLHFYSDVAYNMTGFNISYRLAKIHDQNELDLNQSVINYKKSKII